MSEQLKEALSAALDDEADEFELRRVLDEAGRDESLRETFERYQLIHAVLRGDADARTIALRTQLQKRVRVAMDGDVESAVDTDHQEDEPQIAPDRRPLWMPRAAAFVAAFGAVLAVYFGAGNFWPGSPDSAGGNDVAQGALPVLTTPVTSSPELDPLVSADVVPALSALDQVLRQRHERWLKVHDASVNVVTPLQDDTSSTNEPSEWTIAWIPDGFEALDSEPRSVGSDATSIQRYGNGSQTFSLLIETVPATIANPAESQDGNKWVVERLVGDQADGTSRHLAAVAGELPPPAARRLLGSISAAR
jgi:sigma-E factor negative regulatory protein RseA